MDRLSSEFGPSYYRKMSRSNACLGRELTRTYCTCISCPRLLRVLDPLVTPNAIATVRVNDGKVVQALTRA